MTGRPALVVVLPLEQDATVHLLADSAEDERRLRQWLQHSGELRDLPAVVLAVLDELDLNERSVA